MAYQNSPFEKLKFKPQSSRLMDQVREVVRYHHYSIRTEQSYIKWILAFIRFNGKRHPKELGRSEIEGFLSVAKGYLIVRDGKNAKDRTTLLGKFIVAEYRHI